MTCLKCGEEIYGFENPSYRGWCPDCEREAGEKI